MGKRQRRIRREKSSECAFSIPAHVNDVCSGKAAARIREKGQEGIARQTHSRVRLQGRE